MTSTTRCASRPPAERSDQTGPSEPAGCEPRFLAGENARRGTRSRLRPAREPRARGTSRRSAQRTRVTRSGKGSARQARQRKCEQPEAGVARTPAASRRQPSCACQVRAARFRLRSSNAAVSSLDGSMNSSSRQTHQTQMARNASASSWPRRGQAGRCAEARRLAVHRGSISDSRRHKKQGPCKSGALPVPADTPDPSRRLLGAAEAVRQEAGMCLSSQRRRTGRGRRRRPGSGVVARVGRIGRSCRRPTPRRRSG